MAALNVTTDKPEYAPGEIVTVSLEVTGNDGVTYVLTGTADVGGEQVTGTGTFTVSALPETNHAVSSTPALSFSQSSPGTFIATV